MCILCDKRATFGIKGGRKTHCVEHKTTEESDIANKKCAHIGCLK